ncbi:unnamed protein product, partial [Discosporangium mesarthrocarpum]
MREVTTGGSSGGGSEIYSGAPRRGAFESPPALVSCSPLAELWTVTIDVLDGVAPGGDAVRSGPLSAPRPAISMLVPGSKKPLLGFWGIFYKAVTGPTIVPQEGGNHHESIAESPLPHRGPLAEAVWRVLLDVSRLYLLRRQGQISPVAPRASAVTGPQVGTCPTSREEQISQALWKCVRLLLAASPFATEFAGEGEGQTGAGPTGGLGVVAGTGGDARATTAAEATSPATATGSFNGGRGVRYPLLVPSPEAESDPGMHARVILERVLVLARLWPLDAQTLTLLWQGVQRISAGLAICLNKEVSEAGAGGCRVGARAESGTGGGAAAESGARSVA